MSHEPSPPRPASWSSWSFWSSSPTLVPETASAESSGVEPYHGSPGTAAARSRIPSPRPSLATKASPTGGKMSIATMLFRDVFGAYYCLRMVQIAITAVMLATSMVAVEKLGPQTPGAEPVSPQAIPVFFGLYLLVAVGLATLYSPAGVVFFALQDVAWLPGLIPFGGYLRDLIWSPDCIQSVEHVSDPVFFTLLKVHYLLLFPLWLSLVCSSVAGFIMWHRLANG